MELWTLEHKQQLIPSLAIMVVLAILLRIFIGKKDLKIRMIPFQILACVIVANSWFPFSKGMTFIICLSISAPCLFSCCPLCLSTKDGISKR